MYNNNITTFAKEKKQKWHLIDVKDQILGKITVTICNILRGKNKCNYSSHIDNGDYVIIINAKKILLTGKKYDNKKYEFFSGWRGNKKIIPFNKLFNKNPSFIILHSVKGMLPKNKLSNKLIKKLKIYHNENHPHQSQNPSILKL